MMSAFCSRSFNHNLVPATLPAGSLPALEPPLKLKQPKLQQPLKLQQPKRRLPLHPFGAGSFVRVDDALIYRQKFVIRSYELGSDHVTASIETIINLFQETALNHVGMLDFVGDGMGRTHAMMKNGLIWIITKMHIQMTRYPVWGDAVEIDSWVSGSGKHGMRRDFLVRDETNGQIIARATSNYAMMNQEVRKLSKMPDTVREEISTVFVDRSVLQDQLWKRIPRLDDSAPYIKAGLVARLQDLDMNQHVNHVKYIGWLLESIPEWLQESYELSSIMVEYKKECSGVDVVASLMSPEFPLDTSLSMCHHQQEATTTIPPISNTATTRGSKLLMPLQFIHLLQLQGAGPEVLRGTTEWKPKNCR